MIERELSCRSVLTAEGWLGPALIRIDRAGYVAAVERLPANSLPVLGHVLPGMPNLHSHVFQRQMAGLSGVHGPSNEPAVEEDSFWSWRERMYRLALRIKPDQLRAIAAFVQAEMLEHGYTSCAEFHYLHHQPDGRAYDDPAEMSAQILAAAGQSGMALTLLPVLYCRSGFGSDTVTDRQRRFCNTLDEYLAIRGRCAEMTSKHALHRTGIAPHSLRAVSPQQLRELLQATRDQPQPVHIHISEQRREVEECRAAHGSRPVEWLLQQYPVDDSWCLVHATHMDAAETSAAMKSGAVIGLCPTTEADLGDGFFAVQNWFEAGGRFGVGSDSNLRLSPAEELRLLEFQARLHSGKRNVLAKLGLGCGRSVYEAALQGGAQALGQKVGRIAPGFRADLVELDETSPLLAGRSGDALLDSWILAGDRDMVRSVRVAGKTWVQHGQHIAREQLLPPFIKAMRELL
jgi:formimidoylglutamate deiminase